MIGPSIDAGRRPAGPATRGSDRHRVRPGPRPALHLLQDRPRRDPVGPGARDRPGRRLPRHPPGQSGAHVLLVPRAHHAHLAELPDELAAHVGSLLPRLCRAVQAATGADGLNVIVNNGRVAGQTIDHGHWHIIPRFHDDAVDWPWPQGEYVGDELGQMQFRIERELRANPGADGTTG